MMMTTTTFERIQTSKGSFHPTAILFLLLSTFNKIPPLPLPLFASMVCIEVSIKLIELSAGLQLFHDEGELLASRSPK